MFVANLFRIMVAKFYTIVHLTVFYIQKQFWCFIPHHVEQLSQMNHTSLKIRNYFKKIQKFSGSEL